MKTTLKKHTQATVGIHRLSYRPTMSGYLVAFDDMPGLEVFVARDEYTGFWYRWDPVTGLKFGQNIGDNTRKEAVASLRDFLLDKRLTLGTWEKVVALVEECRTAVLERIKQENP